MKKLKTIHIKNESQLGQFAKRLAKCLKGNEIILLEGDLSAGKTTFTRYLVQSLGLKPYETVTSPTFSIMNEYETSRGTVYHLDFYRVKEFDISDILGNHVILIEWPAKYIEKMNLPLIKIKFEIISDYEREIYIYGKNVDYIIECIK